MILFPSPGSKVGIKHSTTARSNTQEEEAVSSVHVCVGVCSLEIKLDMELDIKMDLNIFFFLIPMKNCTEIIFCAHFD